MGFVAQGLAPTLTIGGRVFTDLENLIILRGGCSPAGANTRTTMRTPNGTSGYVVPTGKVLRLLAVRVKMSGTFNAGAGQMDVGYADNDVGVNSATVFTNSVTMSVFNRVGCQVSADQGGYAEEALNFTIPAGKYPNTENANATVATSGQFYGYLEDV
jgi:hypothetical protein